VPIRIRVGLNLNQKPNIEKFREWKRFGYSKAIGPIQEQIQKGDVIVIDAGGTGDVGFIGSNNSLGWIAAGAVGIVTNAEPETLTRSSKRKFPSTASTCLKAFVPEDWKPSP